MQKIKTATVTKESKKTNIFLDVLVAFSIFLVIGAFAYMILNPSKRGADMRNMQRTTHIASIMTAMEKYIEAKGYIPESIPLNRTCASVENEICKSGGSNCDGYVDLSFILNQDGEDKLTSLPVDGLVGSVGNGTGYYISQDGEGNILLCAPHAERNANIFLKQFVF